MKDTFGKELKVGDMVIYDPEGSLGESHSRLGVVASIETRSGFRTIDGTIASMYYKDDPYPWKRFGNALIKIDSEEEAMIYLLEN